MKDMEIKVCVDLSTQFMNKLFSLFNAYSERNDNILNESYRQIIGADTITEQILLDSGKYHDFEKLNSANNDSKQKLFELALIKKNLWSNGKILKVKFLGGDAFLHQQVIKYAKTWETYANIHFDFITSGDAEIRVAFMIGMGSWSTVGTDALCVMNQNQPTMNFGWFDNSTPDIEFSRTIIHEFGHCLGCIHEHQNPTAKIDWNKSVVYDFYMRSQNWSKAEVDKNIFEKFDQKIITNSAYDSQSIMHYPIPKEHLNSGSPVGWNSVLSWDDIQFISTKYPKY